MCAGEQSSVCADPSLVYARMFVQKEKVKAGTLRKQMNNNGLFEGTTRETVVQLT